MINKFAIDLSPPRSGALSRSVGTTSGVSGGGVSSGGVSKGTSAPSVKGRPTPEERTAVAHMQNMLEILSNTIEFSQELSDYRGYVTILKQTWMDNGGNRDDGKYGPNTINAIKSLTELVTKLEQAQKIKPVYDFKNIAKTFSSDTPENVIEVAKYNSGKIRELILSLGGAQALLSGSGTLFDNVPSNWTDDNAQSLEVGKVRVTSSYLYTLNNFYNLVMVIRVSGFGRSPIVERPVSAKSVPVASGTATKDFVQETGEQLRASVPYSGMRQGRELPDDANDGLASAASRILDACLIKMADVPSTSGSNTSGEILNPWATADVNRTPDPWGAEAKSSSPAPVKKRSSIFKITVGEMNAAINWIVQRASTLVGAAAVTDGTINPATNKPFTEADMASAEKYQDYAQKLSDKWNELLSGDEDDNDVFNPGSLKSSRLRIVAGPSVDGTGGTGGGVGGGRAGGGYYRVKGLTRDRDRSGSGGRGFSSQNRALEALNNGPIKVNNLNLIEIASYAGVQFQDLPTLSVLSVLDANIFYSSPADTLAAMLGLNNPDRLLNLILNLKGALPLALQNWYTFISASGLPPQQVTTAYNEQYKNLNSWLFGLRAAEQAAMNWKRNYPREVR